MSCHAGPDIVENGLVFCYDMNNTQKSWKGAPSINLKLNPNMLQDINTYGAYCSTGPTIQTVYDFPGSINQPKKVVQCVSAASNCGGGNPGGMAFGNPTLTPGLSYTISYWARVLSNATMGVAFSNQNGGGDQSNFSHGNTLTRNWQRYSYTTLSLDLNKGVWFVWANSPNEVFQFGDFQIEQNSFCTPFVAGTRSNTQAIIDLTGNNIITASNLTYNSDGSFSLDGTDDYFMTGPINGIGSSTTSFSMSVWVYPSSTAGNIISMSSTNPSGNWNMPPIAATGQQFFGKIWSNNRLYSSTYSLNTWYNLVLVFNYTTSGQYFYVNGNLTDSQTGITYGASGASNYLFFGQQNPGADNCGMFSGKIGDIKIYTNKALSAAEIAQNFNATRRIYGI